MINQKIIKLRKLIKLNNLDGYIIPKNDAYFSEHSSPNRLEMITNFTGSAGFAIILKNKNYLFVDGRYSIQAKIQSGKYFKVLEIPKISLKQILNNIKKKLLIGFDPELFTSSDLKKKFSNTCNLLPINENLIDKIFKIKKKKMVVSFYSLNDRITGENMNSKINRLIKIMKSKSINNIFISAPENVAWLLNIRGGDNPHSPLPNCKIILTNKRKIYFFSCPKKIQGIKKQKNYKKFTFCTYEDFFKVIHKLKGDNFCIDSSTCSVSNENLINK